MQKEYIVQDGVIGTHHVNREGKSVDFRPAVITCERRGYVVVSPPKGQEALVERMLIVPLWAIKEVVARDNRRVGELEIAYRLFAECMGVEISARMQEHWREWEWYKEDARERCERDIAARTALYLQHEQEEKAFFANFQKEKFPIFNLQVQPVDKKF